ncbi:MAG TPA: permease prefix domain 1-containing protein, partial [Opitutaceae bacterium]|nr:permease prefix domain 1-containing protein [Opitutaceae bacterium]
MNRILSSFRKRKLESDMADEMRHHLEEQTRRNVRAGMPADEAAYAARREFGNLASIQEQAREVRGWLWLDNFLRDLRIGVRVLARERAFFLIAPGILAIGVCGVTAQFSVINSALIRGLPFPDAEQLV